MESAVVWVQMPPAVSAGTCRSVETGLAANPLPPREDLFPN